MHLEYDNFFLYVQEYIKNLHYPNKYIIEDCCLNQYDEDDYEEEDFEYYDECIDDDFIDDDFIDDLAISKVPFLHH
jgi:hypothetical protein